MSDQKNEKKETFSEKKEKIKNFAKISFPHITKMATTTSNLYQCYDAYKNDKVDEFIDNNIGSLAAEAGTSILSIIGNFVPSSGSTGGGGIGEVIGTAIGGLISLFSK